MILRWSFGKIRQLASRRSCVMEQARNGPFNGPRRDGFSGARRLGAIGGGPGEARGDASLKKVCFSGLSQGAVAERQRHIACRMMQSVHLWRCLPGRVHARCRLQRFCKKPRVCCTSAVPGRRGRVCHANAGASPVSGSRGCGCPEESPCLHAADANVETTTSRRRDERHPVRAGSVR